MGSVGGHRGLWGFVRGGMGAVSNAIADSARSRGVDIRTCANCGRRTHFYLDPAGNWYTCTACGHLA